jgi:hypothetical protein
MVLLNSCPASKPASPAVLARPADRRASQFLPVCIQQPLGRAAREASRRSRADQLFDPAGDACRPLSRLERPKGIA